MKPTASLFSILLAACLLLSATSAPAGETTAVIGSIKNHRGAAHVLRQEQRIAARKGLRLFQGDILLTGDGGSLGVVLRDDTLISLGPNSRIAIDEFKFSPAQGELSILTRMTRGIITYISGQIAKLSPESARFETPVSSIGIRGTRFLVKVGGD